MGFQGLDEAMFPTLVDSWGEMGRTDIKTLGASVPITAVIADQQAALIGQGCEAVGAGKITYGTSATVNVSTGKKFAYVGPTLPPFIVSAVGDEVTYCIEGMVFSASRPRAPRWPCRSMVRCAKQGKPAMSKAQHMSARPPNRMKCMDSPCAC
jgi:glycerol kinase